MPRTGYFIAVAIAVIGAVVFPWSAGADHDAPSPPGVEPEGAYWTCSASTARVTLLDGDPIPPVDPLGANLAREECAEDQGGLPDISIPPDDPAPLIETTTAQARTQIFCAANREDLEDPNPALDPEALPEEPDDPATPLDESRPCDAGVPPHHQRVLSTADVTDTTIRLGSGAQALTIVVQAANTTAQARCGSVSDDPNDPGFVPILSGTSQVLGLSIGVGPTQTPFPVPLITGDPNQVIEIPGLVRITLNEQIVEGNPEGADNPETDPQTGEFIYDDDATSGAVTRRAVHVEIPAGEEPTRGSVADAVVAESIADFHGDVCPEGTLTVRKETAPDVPPTEQNPPSFTFTAPGLTAAPFQLADDGERTFEEVAPGREYTVTEADPADPWHLTAIVCAENRTENTETNLAANGSGSATVGVEPGETVNCTFVNSRQPPCPPGSEPTPQGTCVINTVVCPPGSTGPNQQGQCISTNIVCPPNTTGPNGQGQCIVNTITCPPGSTLNQQGQCVSNTTTCPPGSTQNQQGQCIVTNITCPPGSTGPNQQGQCISTSLTCPAGTTGPNGQGQCIVNTQTCPAGSTNVNGQCVVNQANCPAGTTRNAQGQCVISNVQCPAGTTFNPTTLGCTEAPRGGTLVPINQVAPLFRASPCIGQGFGPLVGIVGTNGPDRITGTNQSDRIFALGGNDRVSGGRGDDCVEGGSGRDVLDGSNGNDFLLGGTGNDQVNGGPGRDRFSGGSGRDVMSGGTGNDRMTGGGGRDRLNGGYGNDRLVGGSGNDGIHTGNGRDRVNAGSGNDIINAATVGPPAFVDCGPGRNDRVRINRNERGRVRNCEFIDVPRRIRSNNRPQAPR